jgi:hypothetical protein
MPEDFKAFFSTATGKPEPYDYQSRLAESPCWRSALLSLDYGSPAAAFPKPALLAQRPVPPLCRLILAHTTPNQIGVQRPSRTFHPP